MRVCMSTSSRLLIPFPPVVLALVFAAGMIACRYEPDAIAEGIATVQDEQSIRQVLDQQVADWNAGNIEGFMDGYWRSDSLRFVSNGTVSYGWAETLANYHRRYPSRDSMGVLTFTDLSIASLGSNWASVFGRFNLERSVAGGGDATGLFTLLLHKESSGWKIRMDHTSTEH